MYDTINGSRLLQYQVGIGDTAYYPDVVFSPDDHLLATGGPDHSILLIDTNTGQLVGQPLVGHAGDVGPLAFNPDSRILASGSGQGNFDTSIRLWDPESGQPIGMPLTGHTSSLTALEFSHDGRYLASGDVSGDIIVWDIDRDQQVGSALKSQNSVIDLAFWPDNKTLSSFRINSPSDNTSRHFSYQFSGRCHKPEVGSAK